MQHLMSALGHSIALENRLDSHAARCNGIQTNLWTVAAHLAEVYVCARRCAERAHVSHVSHTVSSKAGLTTQCHGYDPHMRRCGGLGVKDRHGVVRGDGSRWCEIETALCDLRRSAETHDLFLRFDSPTPPLACGSNATVSSLLGDVWEREDGLGPLTVGARPEPGWSDDGKPLTKEETVELLPHANGAVGSSGISH